jgi:hypothetical protein
LWLTTLRLARSFGASVELYSPDAIQFRHLFQECGFVGAEFDRQVGLDWVCHRRILSGTRRASRFWSLWGLLVLRT